MICYFLFLNGEKLIFFAAPRNIIILFYVTGKLDIALKATTLRYTMVKQKGKAF